MKICVYRCTLIAALLGVCACDSDPLVGDAPVATRPDNRLSIYTVNYPLQYLAQRVGGELVDVSFPAPQGIDPADWMPDIEAVAEYQQADLILLNGASYARWVQRVSLPDSRLVDTSLPFAERLLEVEDSIIHTHGPKGEHAHDNLAFTTWLNAQLAKEQAIAVRDALARKLPDSAEVLDANLAALVRDLDALDVALREAFARVGDRPVVYSHPVYQYLDQHYELDGRSVRWEPDIEPDEEELKALGGLSGGIMFWEAEPLSATRKRLQAMDITAVVFDPCANRPDSGDYLDIMAANIRTLAAEL